MEEFGWGQDKNLQTKCAAMAKAREVGGFIQQGASPCPHLRRDHLRRLSGALRGL